MSQIVVVERSFADSTPVEGVTERERRVAHVLQRHGVRWLRTFTSRDLRRMLCFYEAPDADAVAISQDRAGLRLDRCWSGISVSPPRAPALPDGYTTVIVERELTRDFSEAEWRQRAETGAWCLAAHRVALVESLLAPSCRRAVCVFIAPDTEAVRMANGQLGDVGLRAWPCTSWRPT